MRTNPAAEQNKTLTDPRVPGISRAAEEKATTQWRGEEPKRGEHDSLIHCPLSPSLTTPIVHFSFWAYSLHHQPKLPTDPVKGVRRAF